jgi:hypothetical protein
MKRLKTTIPDGGAPLGQFPVLRDIFDTENKDAIEALLTSITEGETEGVILSGCAVTGTAGNFAISAGYVYLDGKVLRYAGGSGFSATRYLQKAADTEETGAFADTVVRAYIDVETAEDAVSAPGGGVQYVTVTFASGGRTLNDLINIKIDNRAVLNDGNTGAATTIKTKIIEIGDWNMDITSSVNIPHGLAANKIRSVHVIIRNNLDNLYSPSPATDTFTQFELTHNYDATNVIISRPNGGVFDSTNYDSTSFNRGWITITYED